MNASIAKARALVCACTETFNFVDKQFYDELIGCALKDIYKNLIRADECRLSDTAERMERQRFQREAIVGCRVLAGLLDSLCDEEAKKSLCERTAEVRRLSAAWLNAEKRQTVQKGAGR